MSALAACSAVNAAQGSYHAPATSQGDVSHAQYHHEHQPADFNNHSTSQVFNQPYILPAPITPHLTSSSTNHEPAATSTITVVQGSCHAPATAQGGVSDTQYHHSEYQPEDANNFMFDKLYCFEVIKLEDLD